MVLTHRDIPVSFIGSSSASRPRRGLGSPLGLLGAAVEFSGRYNILVQVS